MLWGFSRTTTSSMSIPSAQLHPRALVQLQNTRKYDLKSAGLAILIPDAVLVSSGLMDGGLINTPKN
jgi:hypothetical protein